MPTVARRYLPYVLVVLASAWLSSRTGSTGDWPVDSYPAVHSLAAGHVGNYLSAQPMMGPFATLVQAPFVAVSGATGLEAYRWATFPCLLAAGLLGLHLAGIARNRGAGRLTQVLLAVLCLFNPLTFEALAKGHPEEILTAALAVAAVASASNNRPARTGVLLGLAIASKQWAVIAILPTLVALPARRLRVAAGAAAVAAVLMLPGVISAPSSFLGVQEEAAATGSVVTPWSAWYPAASTRTEVYFVGDERLVAHVETAPAPAGPLSHPLILLLAFALPVALALRRGRLPLSAADAMALLALVALLRCALDPVNNLYYHEPVLLALIGWDAFTARRPPLRSLLGLALALVFWRAWHGLSDPAWFNTAYLAVVAGAAFALFSSLFTPLRWTGVRRIRFFAGLRPNSWD
jgi:hypothetical protein